MMKRVAGLTLLLGALSCAEAPLQQGGRADSGQGLRVENARVVLLPGGKDGTAYLDVINSGAKPDRLRSVDSPVIQDIQTHESLEEDGVVRMRARPDGFEVPSAGRLQLKEGGKHIMLMGIAEPPAQGQTILLRLHFDQAGVLEVKAPVTTIGG